MKALNVQPYQASPPSSAVVVGRMVATASASNAVATTTSTRPSVRRPSGGFQIPAASAPRAVLSLMPTRRHRSLGGAPALALGARR